MNLFSKILVIATLLTGNIAAQDGSAWIRFGTYSGGKWGYKDKNGNVKVAPLFSFFQPADTFHSIIAVYSDSNRYYLLKSGKKVGIDSVYLFDFEFDCESEGKILFKDYKADRVGFFNDKGVVIIPPVYNWATSFHNGMAVVRKDARRKCYDEECEHSGWEGGREILINEKNEELVSNWGDDTENLNWYSLMVNAMVPDTQTWISVTREMGNRYSFLSYDREFKKWFYNSFLKRLVTGDERSVKKFLFSRIVCRKHGRNKWISNKRKAFAKYYFKMLKNRLADCNDSNSAIFLDDLFDETLFSAQICAPFKNSCGKHFAEKYPVFEVLKTYYKNKCEIERQECFRFIRTNDGYKLLVVDL